MRDTLVRLGIPSSRILIENQSRTTHDEAVIVTKMLRTLKVDRVVLVTSDIHMRRSLGTFRAEGIDAVPAIARGPFPSGSRLIWLLPTSSALDETQAVAHEFLGIAYYAARGWLRF